MMERVTLRFRGRMLEKLIHHAMIQGIVFESIVRTKKAEAMLITDARGAAVLMELAERFHLDVRPVRRAGFNALKRRVIRRGTLVLSMAVGIFFAVQFLSRVWVIDVHMLDAGTDDMPIYEALDSLGIAPGIAVDLVDTRTLSMMIAQRVADYAYVDVKRQGVRLLVTAAHEWAAPDIYNVKNARDLIANQDALILQVNAMAGTSAVKPGQVVKRGQVLIEGKERDGRETTRGVCALGSVIARVWVTGISQSDTAQLTLVDTGRIREERQVRMKDYVWKMSDCEPFETERIIETRLPIGALFLPVHVVRTRHIEQKWTTVALDSDALREKITNLALEQAHSKLPSGVSTVDKWVDYSMIERGRLRARAVLEFHENIAVSRGSTS